MQETITFHITSEDKERLRRIAELKRLSLSSYIRFVLINRLKKSKTEQD